ncbi:hypothetical protein VTN77DRAFT_5514 [Rasamsonia byssochlamydoides]|uniref:uncharacterized protein n=1 Tax=Rasamsonia byssochlamydoides TaxID=89139 RepID=UPI0037439BCC
MKNMHISVNRSLKKLRTDYIDLLYVHWWDFTTSVEEVMHRLNVLIMAGKVLYLGVLDTPAWNARFRDMEREVVPMCWDQGMGIAPWAPRWAGRIQDGGGAEEGGSGAEEGCYDFTALAYILHKTPYVFPIVGQRKIEHLKANVDALSIQLSEEDMREIDEAVPFDVGFPMNFIFPEKYTLRETAADVFWTQWSTYIDAPPNQMPIMARSEV